MNVMLLYNSYREGLIMKLYKKITFFILIVLLTFGLSINNVLADEILDTGNNELIENVRKLNVLANRYKQK